MIKKLVFVFLALLATYSYAQQGSASPYSYYGVGTVKFKGTVENRSMGGLSIYSDSIHINLRNPASYGGNNVGIYPYGGAGRPVKFTLAGSYTDINIKTENGSDKASTGNFEYLAMSIPLGKLGFGFGIIPFTSVGYKLESLDETTGEVENNFEGEGGVNKVFLGFGYQLTKDLSVGVDASYNFGNIKNTILEYGYDSDGRPLEYQSLENNRSDLSGVNFNIGVSYKTMLTEKYELVAGLTYSPQSTLVSKNERTISSVTVSNTGQTIPRNRVEIDLGANGLEKTDLTLPSRFSFGAGIGIPRRWFIGAEYTAREVSAFENDFYESADTSYENGSTFSVGGFYIPQYNSFTSFFKRAVYRAGYRYERTGLNIKGESITEFGITFGLGLPVGEVRLLSNANVGFEFGRRGTTNENLIQENFLSFQLSLSLNDRWFQKRKYD